MQAQSNINIVETVREFYGDVAAELVANGWTVDAAINHVTGSCDVLLCAHQSHGE